MQLGDAKVSLCLDRFLSPPFYHNRDIRPGIAPSTHRGPHREPAVLRTVLGPDPLWWPTSQKGKLRLRAAVVWKRPGGHPASGSVYVGRQHEVPCLQNPKERPAGFPISPESGCPWVPPMSPCTPCTPRAHSPEGSVLGWRVQKGAQQSPGCPNLTSPGRGPWLCRCRRQVRWSLRTMESTSSC